MPSAAFVMSALSLPGENATRASAVRIAKSKRLSHKNRRVFKMSNKLRRSRHNRIVAGVCGGLGEFFDISPFWFRLLFLVLLIPGGLPGLVPYLILWIVIPKRRRR